MVSSLQLSEESYNIFGYLDCHRYKTYGKECRAVFRYGQVKYQCHKKAYEEETIEQISEFVPFHRF